MAYTWIPFYKELAQKLLQNKTNRLQLVEWIKSDLNKVKTKRGGHSLISYLTKSDYFQKVNDIDPFSVFGLFNRNNQRGDLGRRELLLMFQDHFELSSDIPSDFNGIPHIDINSANFLGIRNKNITINFLWNFFEKILNNDSISTDFNYLISNGVSIRDLSLILYLLEPDKFLPLNDSNIKMLQMYKIKFDLYSFTYDTYNSIMDQLHESHEIISFKSFVELTVSAIELDKTDRIWMWKGDETTFTANYIECGSDMAGIIDIASFNTRESFRAKYQKIKGKSDYITPAAYWDFANEVSKGEIVVVFGNNSGGHILYGWGEIVSQCEFNYKDENPLKRFVKWHSYSLKNIKKESLTKNKRFFHCVSGIEAFNIMSLLNIKEKSKKEDGISINSIPLFQPVTHHTISSINDLQNATLRQKYSDSDFLDEVFVTSLEYSKLKNLLLRKKNLILHGAPGVGKTFAARRLAYAIMGEKDKSRVMQIQFHQNYSYEDFVIGYKPNAEGGFSLVNGIFYDFCQQARAHREMPYFLIIDEINRGNLSKIFGELLQLIEADYRDQPLQLAYNKQRFSVPSNLYIIGMMNTADRSLAMIDYALRRRFSFFEMKPGFETDAFHNFILGWSTSKLRNLINAIIELNKVITDDDSLGSGFCIGHSYLCNLNSDSDLESIVEYDIIPMLREYWFDNDDKFNQEAQKLRNALK